MHTSATMARAAAEHSEQSANITVDSKETIEPRVAPQPVAEPGTPPPLGSQLNRQLTLWHRVLLVLLSMLAILALAGCGGGSKASCVKKIKSQLEQAEKKYKAADNRVRDAKNIALERGRDVADAANELAQAEADKREAHQEQEKLKQKLQKAEQGRGEC